jgi:hypothetical protein
LGGGKALRSSQLLEKLHTGIFKLRIAQPFTVSAFFELSFPVLLACHYPREVVSLRVEMLLHNTQTTFYFDQKKQKNYKNKNFFTTKP